MPKKSKHEWDEDTNFCKRCGLHITKVYDLVYDCHPVKAKRVGYRKAPKKKRLGES